MNWNGSSQCIYKWETSQKKSYLYLYYTNINKVKAFCVLHDKVALLTRRYSERERRNRHQIIFRKLIKRWIITLKLILDFLFTDFSQHLEYIGGLRTILFMGMGKKWGKVICFVKLSHGATTQIENQKFSKFREHQQKTFAMLSRF